MDDDFQAIEAQFYGAMQAGNVAVLDRMLDEECIYVHSFGARDTKVSYLEKVAAKHFIYRRIDFTQDRVLRRGDTTIVTGTMSGVVSVNGLERRLNNVRSSVWLKQGGVWKLVLFQPTPWLDR